MTTWRGWQTCGGIVRAVAEGRVKTSGDLSALKNLISQASYEQRLFLRDRLRPYLTESGMAIIFGRDSKNCDSPCKNDSTFCGDFGLCKHTRGRAV